MYRLRCALVGCLAIGLAATSASADTISPGKESAFASSADVSPLPNSDPANPLLSVTIEKGKRRRVLVIEATVEDRSSALILLRIGPSVNGVGVQGPNASVNCDPANGVTVCTASGVWWLDLDAAEAASPGTFVGQPLVVKLVGGDAITADGPGPGPYGASLVVRMVKKK